jgi:hypothetical protein
MLRSGSAALLLGVVRPAHASRPQANSHSTFAGAARATAAETAAVDVLLLSGYVGTDAGRRAQHTQQLPSHSASSLEGPRCSISDTIKLITTCITSRTCIVNLSRSLLFQAPALRLRAC